MSGDFAALLAQVIPVLILALVLDARARVRDALAAFKERLTALEDYDRHLAAASQPGMPAVAVSDVPFKESNRSAWYVVKLFIGQTILLLLLGIAEYHSLQIARMGGVEDRGIMIVIMGCVVLGLLFLVTFPVREFMHGAALPAKEHLVASSEGRKLLRRDLLIWVPAWTVVIALFLWVADNA